MRPLCGDAIKDLCQRLKKKRVSTQFLHGSHCTNQHQYRNSATISPAFPLDSVTLRDPIRSTAGDCRPRTGRIVAKALFFGPVIQTNGLY
jgi:hypothetical protein